MGELLSLIRRGDWSRLFKAPTTNPLVQLWLVERLGAHYQVAAVFGFFAGLAVNYLLSKLLVFQTEKARTRASVEFLGYALIGAVGLAITMGLMHVFTEWVGLHFMLSKIIATLIVLIWNFTARKLILYQKQSS